MSALLRLLRGSDSRALALPVLGGVLLGALTVLSGVGLLTASGALISRAALRPESLLLLLPLITSVRLFGISRAALRYAERLVSHDLTFRLIARVRAGLFARLVPLAPAALQGERGGDLLARVRADVDELQGAYLRLFSPALIALLACGVSLALLWALSPALALVTLALYLALGVALPWGAQRLTRRLGGQLPTLRAQLAAQVLAGVQGAADVLASGAAGAARAQVDALLCGVEAAEARRARVSGAANALRDLAGGAGVLAALGLVGAAVARGETPGFLLAAAALGLLGSFEAVGNLAPAWAAAPEIWASARRVAALQHRAPAVHDPARPRPLPCDLTLRWEHVTFGYEVGEAPVLIGFSWELPPGARLALVGPSGAGKSTVLRLALRFWDPQVGRVTLGGVDLRELSLADVRSRFAWAPQQAELFDGTLRDNLLADAPDDDCLAVLRDLGLDGLLERLPGGLDGWVGEYGVRLSGGERARLSVARALLSPAPILLLDEPTAHLDEKNARCVLRVVSARAGVRGVLIVTHQPTLLAKLWTRRDIHTPQP